MDLFGAPSLPFGASLELDDQLFGDEFLHLLTSDLAMDCDAGMGLAPLDLDTSPATSSHLSDNTQPPGSCAPPSPASQPQSSSGESERPILLPAMAVSRGPKAKTTIAPNVAAGLPSLVAGNIVRAWTVTTDVNLQSSAPAEQPPPAPAVAPPVLTHKPSGDSSALQAPRTRRRGPAKPSVQASEDMDEDTDSEDSNDTQDEEVANCEPKSGNKRKAPDVDWRSITDPVERRRQRRLAKNRVTAARSRERKKSQWAVMEAAQQKLETENRALRDALNAATQDNQSLRAQLEAALGRGLGADATSPATTDATGHLRGNSHTEPAVLVLIATLLTVCVLTLPSDQAAVVFGAAAAALLLLKRLQSTKSNLRSWSCGPGAADAATVKIEQLLLEGQQQAAAASARKKSGRARAGTRKPPSKEVVFKVEPEQGDGALSVVESGGLAQWLASAVCILGKARKASRHGLPERRAGNVPVGLFVL